MTRPISEAEERVHVVEDAVLEMLKLQEKLEARLTDQEDRSRRENIRGIAEEGVENNSTTMATFVEILLREIPASTEDLDRVIFRFIWHWKKPQIRVKTLQLSKENGGLSLPNIKDYYRAAQIKNLVDICNPSYTAKWKEIEYSISSDIPLQAVIGDTVLIKRVRVSNPWIMSSLKMVSGAKRSQVPGAIPYDVMDSL